MAAPEAPIREIYVQPGESHLVSEPAVLRTLLGSCVGITFQAPRLGVGGLCHPMMPRCPPGKLQKLSTQAARRYVDFAVRNMASQLDALGASRAEVVVKLFGGNDVLTTSVSDPERTIGKMNCEAAVRVLAEEGFTVAASRLGGTTGVYITFDTATGEVLLRRLANGLLNPERKAKRNAQHSDRSRENERG